jgi:hypothetical protein
MFIRVLFFAGLPNYCGLTNFCTSIEYHLWNCCISEHSLWEFHTELVSRSPSCKCKQTSYRWVHGFEITWFDCQADSWWNKGRRGESMARSTTFIDADTASAAMSTSTHAAHVTHINSPLSPCLSALCLPPPKQIACVKRSRDILPPGDLLPKNIFHRPFPLERSFLLHAKRIVATFSLKKFLFLHAPILLLFL